MIKVDRPAAPLILQRKAAGWACLLAACEVLSDRKRLIDKYRHKQIKEALVSLFSGKCAYCETHQEQCQIDHFRPQASFPELTFEWNNVFPACATCNGSRGKSGRFPNENEGGPLVNPCDDEPDAHFDFVYNSDTMSAHVYGKTERGELSERTYGLNRLALLIQRSKRVRTFIALARLASSDAEAAALFREACEASSEYAAFARNVRKGEPAV